MSSIAYAIMSIMAYMYATASILTDTLRPMAKTDELSPGAELRRLRKSRGLSYRQAAKLAGLSHTYIMDLENKPGKIEGVSLLTLEKLARAYGVNKVHLENIFTGRGNKAHSEEDLADLTLPVKVYRIPIVDAGAGLPRWTDEAEMIEISLPELHGKSNKQLFCVRINGDSMAPYAKHGDRVVFDTEGETEGGKVVAVQIPDDGIVVKRFLGTSADKRLLLGSDNPSYTPFEAPPEARIRGVSVGTWRPD